MRKFYHLLPKPVDTRTRAERLQDREQFSRDMNFAKMYGMFFGAMILLILAVSVFAKNPEEIEEIEIIDSIAILHAEICQAVPKSPLCVDIKSLEKVDKAAREKGVPTRLVIGIWNAESTIGVNFNKPACYSYYNWAGLKGRKFDDGRVEWYSQNRKRPDENGCWLYKFSSWEEGVNSFLNTLAIGYKGCDHKTRCIAYAFVGNPNVAEESWIRNVGKFYKSE